MTDVTLPTQPRPFRISLPSQYGPSAKPPPLLLHFHGWGGTLSSGDAFHVHGIAHGYLGAHPAGALKPATRPPAQPAL